MRLFCCPWLGRASPRAMPPGARSSSQSSPPPLTASGTGLRLAYTRRGDSTGLTYRPEPPVCCVVLCVRSIFSDVDELTVQLPSLLNLDRLRMPRLSITPLLDMNMGLRHSPFAFRGSVPSLSLVDETPQAYTYQIQLPVGSSGVVDDKDVDVAVSHDKMLRIRYASNDGDAMGGSLSILEIVEQVRGDGERGADRTAGLTD